MFGSHYILNAHDRLLWGLDYGLRQAKEGPPPLAELASQLAQAPIGNGFERWVALPFHTLWVAVLANQGRYQGPRPDAALATGLIAIARDCGISPPEGAIELARGADGCYLAPGPDREIIAIDRVGGEHQITLDGFDGLLLLGDNPLLRHLIGDGPSALSKLPEDWAPSLAAGLALLAKVSPEQHRRVLRYVSVVASFEAERGLLQSLSMGEWPGCVVARCDNPPAHVGDQLVHEASHQLLDMAFASDPDLVVQLEAAPAAYSPFFQQPRPCLKLVHGLVSYLEVLRLWRAIIAAGQWDAELTEALARFRAKDVRSMCIEGIRSLRAAAAPDQWERWRAFLVEVAPEFTHVERDAKEPESPANLSTRSLESISRMELLPVSQAELVLALDGVKVSRVSLSLDEGAQLARALSPEFVPLFSRSVMVTRHEHLKGSFTNLTAGTFEYYRPPPGAFVHAYVSQSSEASRLAVLADEENEAGTALGIPACCCTFFRENWERAQAEYQGDLAALLLASQQADGVPRRHPWQTNAFAMYFGRGMTWHFPCSWDCAATIAVIDERAEALERRLPEMAHEFRRWHLRPIVWCPGHGILAADLDGALDRITLAHAVALEENEGLDRVRAAGSFEWRHGTWRAHDGRGLAEMLGTEARVLLWY